MTVQELRNFLAQETVNNEADVYLATEDGCVLMLHAEQDADGDVILSDEVD